MKTKQIEAFGGRATFEVRAPTLLAHSRIMAAYDAAIEELGEAGQGDGEEAIWRRDIVYFVCITENVTVDDKCPDLEPLAGFWSLATNGTSPLEYTEYFLENVHSGVYREWGRVSDQRISLDLLDVPAEQRAQGALSAEERADPN